MWLHSFILGTTVKEISKLNNLKVDFSDIAFQKKVTYLSPAIKPTQPGTVNC